jgi:hypothetical protein
MGPVYRSLIKAGEMEILASAFRTGDVDFETHKPTMTSARFQ